jgi:hypothetical protein
MEQGWFEQVLSSGVTFKSRELIGETSMEAVKRRLLWNGMFLFLLGLRRNAISPA